MTLIKRYSNRKLYNTDSRRYITLDELGNLVKEGEEIQVIDNVSGEDITEKILIQVILANGGETSRVLPRSFLSELIQAGSKPILSFQMAVINYLQKYQILEIPSRQDIIELAEQIELLEEKIDQLTSRSDNSP